MSAHTAPPSPGARPPAAALSPTWRKALSWFAVTLVAWLLLKLLAPVLTPFVIALVLAYSLSPLVQRACRRLPKVPRPLVALGAELLFLVIVVAAGLLLVPVLTKEIPILLARLPLLLQQLHTALAALLGPFGLNPRFDPQQVRALLLQYLSDNGADVWEHLLPSLKVGGSAVLTLVGYGVLIPVALFYLLADWEKLTRAATRLIPRSRAQGALGFWRECDKVLGEYMRAQLSVMLILALGYSAGLALWGLDLALPIGLFTGLAMFVPYIGFGVGLVLALLAGLAQFGAHTTALMLLSVYGLGQVVEGFYLTPRLVGERVGLHPLAIIFALMAFGQMFGFIGVLLALPASSVLLVALRRLRAQYMQSDLYQ